MEIYQTAIKKMQEERLTISQELLNGRASTFDAYRELVGRGTGLEQAINILKQTLKEADENE